MNKTFFDQARLLDSCRLSKNPTESQVELVLSMIADEKYARYFFDQLDNPVWASILAERGYFLHSPEPIEIVKGSFVIPTWPAAIYLVKVAKSVPGIVLSVIRKIETDNSRVHESLLDALAELSSKDAVQVLENVNKWLASRFASFIPIKYSVLIEKWLSDGFVNEAISLYEVVVTPELIKSNDKSSATYRSPLRFQADPYWINEAIQKHYSHLLSADCEGLFAVYDRQVRRCIELVKEIVGTDVDIFTGFRWRYDIPYSSSSASNLDSYNVLLDGLRDSLLMLCKEKPEKGREKLSNYMNDEFMIFRRIGIFVLRSFGQEYLDLLVEILGKRDYLESRYFHSEYVGLLRYQFGAVSDDLRQRVISWILDGPLDVDERALHRAQWQKREIELDDKKVIVEEWRLTNFAIIAEYLPEKIKNILDDLVAKRGRPDTEERPTISTTVSWGNIPSPVSVDELAKLSLDELFDLLMTQESEDSFQSSIESLAQTFGSIVQSGPEKYRNFVYQLIDPRIKNIYVYNYLDGVSKAIKNGKEKLSEEVVTLCESVVEKEEDQREIPDSYGVSLIATQLQAGWLIENALRSDDPYLTESLLSRVKEILFILARHPNPLPEDDGGSFDPFTQSMNCVRGVAMHAIMHYLLYTDRQRKKTSNKESHKPSMDVEVQQVLQDKLDISKDRSLAVHSVFGAYLPQLYYLDHDWVTQNIQRIFPESDDYSKYWQASWDAYISSSNVYRGVFELLVSHYQRALQLLSVPRTDEKPWISPDERLAQHIMFAYINEFTDFGHENNLLDLFFDNASDEVRSRAVFWLSKVLDDAKPSSEDRLWERLWKMWRARVDAAITSEETNIFRHEISDYMRWLANAPVDLGFLIDILKQSIKFLNDGYSVQLMASFAAKHCERYPLEAVRLIHDAIMSVKEPWWSPGIKDEETILRTAIASGNSNAKDVAIDVINYRGEQGDFRWKYLLE